jgi:AraC-like DNA-binding protein
MAARTAQDVARTNSDRAARHLAQVAQTAALHAGYEDLSSLVLARIADGASLAAISLEAGLHKDWLSRHLANVDAASATVARQASSVRLDARWRPALEEMGFPDIARYLRQRHLVEHRTVNAIAAEIGISNHTVTAALRRHGLTHFPHAARRHAASRRANQVAAAVGHANIVNYVAQRRGQG